MTEEPAGGSWKEVLEPGFEVGAEVNEDKHRNHGPGSQNEEEGLCVRRPLGRCGELGAGYAGSSGIWDRGLSPGSLPACPSSSARLFWACLMDRLPSPPGWALEKVGFLGPGRRVPVPESCVSTCMGRLTPHLMGREGDYSGLFVMGQWLLCTLTAASAEGVSLETLAWV